MYEKLDSGDSYPLELIKNHELTGYLDDGISSRNVLVEVNKHGDKCPFDYVYIESKPERDFVNDCELNTAVLVYTKLPSKFVIPTPLGTYNPDWALLIQDTAGDKRLYFIAETKSTWIPEERRPSENAKIKCAEVHFTAIFSEGSEIIFQDIENLSDILQTI